MSDRIVLASASVHRADLLTRAGIVFEVRPAEIDERAAEAPFAETGSAPADVARILAEIKAVDVSNREPGALVIGCDQILSLDDAILHKAATMEEARRRLLKLAGDTHQLSSAVVIARDGAVIWDHVGVAHMTMRALSPQSVGRYLSAAGPSVLGSVGVYQIEGPGIQLFDGIDGDFFTIVGLPLLALIKQLRRLGALDD